MLRVLLCDDAVGFPDMLTAWLEERPGVEVIQASDPAEAVGMVSTHRPDVIVLDHMLTRLTSEEVVPRFREADPRTRIVLISSLPDDDLEEVAHRAGVAEFISKTRGPEAMCQVIWAGASGMGAAG